VFKYPGSTKTDISDTAINKEGKNMEGIPFETLVFYKVNRTPFLSQRGSNTGCRSFKFFVQREDNVINLTRQIRQKILFFEQLLEHKLQLNKCHSLEAVPQTQNDV
jgi:hypothetical protein